MRNSVSQHGERVQDFKEEKVWDEKAERQGLTCFPCPHRAHQPDAMVSRCLLLLKERQSRAAREQLPQA